MWLASWTGMETADEQRWAKATPSLLVCICGQTSGKSVKRDAMESPLRVYSVEEARRTVLRRRPLDEMELPPAVAERLARIFGAGVGPAEAVARILASVREQGDAAVRDWTRRIDGVELDSLLVPPEAVEAAYAGLGHDLREALEAAARRIEAFHRRQPIHSWLDAQPAGTLGQLVRPIARVGLYVPGGNACYPSSLLMAAIPARVAGVETLVVATPPGRETGLPAPGILAAARIAGVDRIYRIGGAQAIAALAYGTETVEPVDKICGPGNLFVTLAKRAVMGTVGIDGLPGPTETVVVADELADPRLVAADLLAQAEHDLLATALLLTPSPALAERAAAEVARQVAALPRGEATAEALRRRGGAVVTGSLEEAIELANAYAPEHLCLSVADPWAWLGRVRNAGGVFLGEASCETLGDYVAGPSHVMPTGGTARFASPLSVADFVKITSVIALGAGEASGLAPIAARLARFEGLDAHAAAAEARSDGSGQWSLASSQLPGERSPTGTTQRGTEHGARITGHGQLTTDHGPAAPIRPDVASMPAYAPVEPPEVWAARLGIAPERLVKLDANENPYGPSPRARRALAGLGCAHIYPDPSQRALRAALSEWLEVDAERLLVGHGSDELIDLTLRLLLGPGDAIIDCPPTFGMYRFSAAVCGGQVRPVPRRPDFALDVEAIEAAAQDGRVKAILVASPNNPDGSVAPPEAIERLLRLPLVVVVDEAYIEFSGLPSLMAWGERHDNLVVLRTFSKWAGLAGLRVGYGLFPPALLAHLWKIKPPYNVNVAGATAALASLEDLDHLQANVARLIAQRERLQSELARFSFLRPYPSRANFVLCRVSGLSARQVRDALRRRGVLVRYFEQPGLTDCIRISSGTPEQVDALLAALRQIAEEDYGQAV